jgi:5-formyltetrahydrofolate cyclo-ligase
VPLPADLKQQLRQKFKNFKLTPAEHEQQSMELTLKLLQNPIYAKSEYILSYAATGNEPSSSYLNRQLLLDGKHLFLPILENNSIGEVKEEYDLVKNKLGIFEPKQTAPESFISKLDLVIIPGLAFDKQRYRLGHGSSWYDRFLPKLPASCLKIGFCFNNQVIALLPHDKWDIQLDLIISSDQVQSPL